MNLLASPFARRLIHAGKRKLSACKFTEEELKSLSEIRRPLGCRLPVAGRDGQLGKRLLVVMVGWAESRLNVLAKYAGIYTHLGLPCVMMAPPITRVFYTSLGNRAAKDMLRLLDQTFSASQPVHVLYHFFSGGGSVVFPHLLAKHDRHATSKLLPAGVVFDSGPTWFSHQSGLAASKLMYKQGAYGLATHVLLSTLGVLTNVAIGSKKRSELSRVLEHPNFLALPQLYLYSESDSVCLPDRVQQVTEGQRGMGRQVTAHSWTDSEHVRHYPQHPEEYTLKIADFLATLDLN